MTCAYCGEKFTPAARGPGKHRKYCSARCRRDAYEKQGPGDPCVVCGGPCGTQRRGSTTSRCDSCRCAALRAPVEERARKIEKWWAKGLTVYQIGDLLGGWTKDQVGIEIANLRRQGYDLPHRRTPEQVARIKAGWQKALDRRLAA